MCPPPLAPHPHPHLPSVILVGGQCDMRTAHQQQHTSLGAWAVEMEVRAGWEAAAVGTVGARRLHVWHHQVGITCRTSWSAPAGGPSDMQR